MTVWPGSTIGEVCSLTSGGTPSKSNGSYWSGKIPWVSAKDLKLDRISDAALHISEDAVENSATAIAPIGSLLILVRGMGLANGVPIAEVTAPVAFNQDIRAIHPPSGVFPRFLLLALRHHLATRPADRVLSLAAHGTLKIEADALRQFAFPIPPPSEQRRIVAALDKAFSGIATAKANAERNLQNARALFERDLEFVFSRRLKGWGRANLKALTTKIGSGATPRGGHASYKPEGTSLIRSLNVHDLGFSYPKLAFLDEAQARDLANVEVQRGDVLLNITGASVARCCVVPDNVLPARVNQHVSIIRPIAERLNSKFLHYLLISKPYKDKLLQTGAEGGATRQAITKAQLQEFSIAYPASIREQTDIVAKLDATLAKTQQLEAVYQRKSDALVALKESLLRAAFSGEL